MRIALSVLLTCWPPAPLARKVSMRSSAGFERHLLGLVGLGQHGDRAGAGVDAALRLGRRHALHAVAAGLELELRVDVVALDADHQLPCSRRGRSRSRDMISVRQPLALGVAQVHAHQVAGEQRRFVAAGAGADFEEGVARVVRVARQQRGLQLGVQAFDSRPRRRRFPRAPSRPSSAVVGEQLAARRPRSRSRCSKRRNGSTSAAHLGMLARELAVALHVAGDAAVGEQSRRARPGAARGVRIAGGGSLSWAERTDGADAAARRRRAPRARRGAASAASACRRRVAARCWRRNRRDTVCASCARCVAVGGVQLGQRAVQHLLRQAARQRLEHRVDVLALGQQLARARDLERAPVVGLRVAAPGSAAPSRAGRASARSSARRSR